MAASKAILFEHDTLMIRPEQDQLLENLVHMVNTFINTLFFVLLKAGLETENIFFQFRFWISVFIFSVSDISIYFF